MYTKGEWKAHFEYLGGYDAMSHSYDIEAGEQHIATLDLDSYESANENGETEEEVNAPEAKANAYLIAAAPAMYEALKEITREAPNPQLAYGKVVVEIARQAIALADREE